MFCRLGRLKFAKRTRDHVYYYIISYSILRLATCDSECYIWRGLEGATKKKSPTNLYKSNKNESSHKRGMANEVPEGVEPSSTGIKEDFLRQIKTDRANRYTMGPIVVEFASQNSG